MNDLPKIGNPATRALAEQGITSLREVVKWSENELLSLHGVGPKAIRILNQALAENGLSLKVTEE